MTYNKDLIVRIFEMSIRNFNEWLSKKEHLVNESPISVFVNFLKKNLKTERVKDAGFITSVVSSRLDTIDRLTPINFNIVFHAGYIQRIVLNHSGMSNYTSPYLVQVREAIGVIDYEALQNDSERTKAESVLTTTSAGHQMDNIIAQLKAFNIN